MQMLHASEEMKVIAESLKGKTDDVTVINALKFVWGHTKYVRDIEKWKTKEKWQAAEETLGSGTGDCEDGSILLLVLCRLAGVNSKVIRVNAGSVLVSSSNNFTSAKMENNIKVVDITHLKWYLQKETSYGIIQQVLQQELEKENGKVLKQNLRRVQSLKIKEQDILDNLYAAMDGKLLKFVNKYVKYVEKKIEKNYKYTTLIKIEQITIPKIYRYYVLLVILACMEKKEIQDSSLKVTFLGMLAKRLRKLSERITETNKYGGHCWVEYRSLSNGQNYFLDGCYNIDLSSIKYRKNSSELLNYYKIWWGFNDKENYKGYKL